MGLVFFFVLIHLHTYTTPWYSPAAWDSSRAVSSYSQRLVSLASRFLFISRPDFLSFWTCRFGSSNSCIHVLCILRWPGRTNACIAPCLGSALRSLFCFSYKDTHASRFWDLRTTSTLNFAFRISTGAVANTYCRIQHHPNHPQQGLPPPHHLQHRPSAVIQQHSPDSPQQPQSAGHAPAQGPYASPHSSSHSFPQHHQSPYVGGLQGAPGHPQTEGPYFGAHPSPYSTASTSGSYSTSGELF